MIKNIQDKTIEAARKIKDMKAKYGISQDDLAELHRAYAQIHTEHILTQTITGLSDLARMQNKMQKCDRAISELEGIKRHLASNFNTPEISKATLKRL